MCSDTAHVKLAGVLVMAAAGFAGQDGAVGRYSEYVGANVCAGCHAEIYKLQQSSTHAKSLRRPEAIPELVQSLPFRYEDRVSLSTLTLRRDGEGRIEISASKDNEQQKLVLGWAFGSGTKGITGVGIRADGSYVESRLSWYASERSYALTTGATKYDPQNPLESLGRALTNQQVQECFFCHTTAYGAEESGPSPIAMGIHCERCHGPGAKHAQLMAGAGVPRGAGLEIRNPGRLPSFSQIEMCGTCHGTPPRDTDLAALRFIEQTPRTARFPSERLVLSRCFNESPEGLKCTFCHDPHASISDDRAHGDQTCKSCHRKGGQSGARICQVSTTACASCHMPRERVMLHSEFTDHWIRVVRAARR